MFSTAISAFGGVTPLQWSTSGLVPAGLALNSTTGVLEGTPEIAGHYQFTVEVQDSGSPPVGDEKSFKIRTEDGSTTPVSGASGVDIWNCHPENRMVHIWTNDLTAVTGWQEKASLASQHDESVLCPPDDAEPFHIDLADGHEYLIAGVDPGKEACPDHQNDPNLLQCLHLDTFSIVGNASGGVLPITII